MGYQVAPFKVGPDFIDPGHHGKITGKTSFNLDSWMLSKEYNTKLFIEKTKESDIAVIEGVMGLFDGYDALTETGSTAQMAKWLGLPVVLVINAGGMARSAAAIVKGFEEFDSDLKIAGVIFSKTGSIRHYEYLKKSVEQNCKTKCLGFMPKNENVIMPERHLGLVTADEFDINSKFLLSLVSMVEDHIDMPSLINSLDSFKMDSFKLDTFKSVKNNKPIKKEPDIFVRSQNYTATIAVARDKAFCFYYQDNLDILRKFGAKIIEFSPLNGEKLPKDIDGIYLGGGYPEVFARQLSENRTLLCEIKKESKAGMPIYGECGGFMSLCNKLYAPNATDETLEYSMSECFNFSVKMSKRLRSLGYREITFKEDCIIGKKGEKARGHEFHYSSLINFGENPDDNFGENSENNVHNIYKVTSRAGQNISLQGFKVANTLGSYLHIHFGSNENCARQFVESCKKYRDIQ
jgi:cobyrinic acid a,c-diamide synthase